LHTGGRTGGGKPDLEHRSRWIRSILAGPLQHEPGAAWSYSTAGYVMLGEIIRRVTGLSHEEAFRRILLDPLGFATRSSRCRSNCGTGCASSTTGSERFSCARPDRTNRR